MPCADLEARATELEAQAFASADRSCTVDADCVVTTTSGISCPRSCGFAHGPMAVSAGGRVRLRLLEIEAGVCSIFNGNSCPAPERLSCSPPSAETPGRCVDNRCVDG